MLDIKLSASDGRIEAITGGGLDFCAGRAPLFRMRLLRDGCFSAADSVSAARFTSDGGRMTFADFGEGLEALTVVCEVKRVSDDEFEWYLNIQNDTDYIVESAEYPCICGRAEGDMRVFRAFTEGVELTHFQRLDPAAELLKPDRSVNIYPGFVTMQYLAYYNASVGLYFAAHDCTGVPKFIRAFETPDGDMSLSIRSCHAVLPHTSREAGFPMVVSLTGGGWESSAERYRSFLEGGGFPLPKKLAEDDGLPEWYKKSPVVVIYPPRSYRGTGYYGANEFYPYENGMKYIDELSKEFGGAPIMAFLAYWEGSAPWAPPYNWPPFGELESFRRYVKLLHSAGHYIGLYGSGLNWTDKHLLCPEYDMTGYRETHGINGTLCVKPDGSFYEGACQTIRSGYHMCPGVKETRDIAMSQSESVVSEGVDFFQLFDQDMGGFGCQCYSKDHGHPPVLGEWETGAQRSLYRELSEMSDGRCIFGTESAAADFFMKYLRFNDLRENCHSMADRIVPAYEYVTHEYISNFSGNLSGLDRQVPHDKNPDCFIYCLAYSLAAGDLLTVPMKSGGEIHWEWGMSWLIPGPDRADAVACVKNYNAFRSGVAAKYLYGGRMLRAKRLDVGGEPLTLHTSQGCDVTVSYVQTTRWRASDGGEAQVCASFSREPKRVILHAPVKALLTADGPLPFETRDGVTEFTIPPFTAALACQ